jgi:hypothetical protein
MKHLIQTSMLSIAMLFANLFAYSTIRLHNNEVAFDSAHQECQHKIKRIKASYGDGLNVNINDKIRLFRLVCIHPNNTGNKLGSLKDKLKCFNIKSIKESDTETIQKVINESDQYCQNVFKKSGYPCNSLYTLKKKRESQNVWFGDLKNIYYKGFVDLDFNEYYSGIKIEGAEGQITIANGKINRVKLIFYANSNVNVTATKPMLSLSQAIQSYYNKKQLLMQTTSILPYSRLRDVIVNGCINNIPIDSLPQKDLVYVPNEVDSSFTLCWKIYIVSKNNSMIAWVNAITGEIVHEGGATFR